MHSGDRVGLKARTNLNDMAFQVIEDTFSSGYNWCVDTIKMSSQHSQLANDLEINKAVMFLKQKDFASAVDTLKTFEKQV